MKLENVINRMFFSAKMAYKTEIVDKLPNVEPVYGNGSGRNIGEAVGNAYRDAQAKGILPKQKEGCMYITSSPMGGYDASLRIKY